MNRFSLIIAVLIILILTTLSFIRSSLYIDDLTLWTSEAGKNPNRPRVLNNLAMALMVVEKNEEALPLLQRALELDPDFLPARTNLALVFLSMGSLIESEMVFTQIIQDYPNAKEAIFARKMIAFISRQRSLANMTNAR
jgi:tetratricopeptide (TPR) repeat protein